MSNVLSKKSSGGNSDNSSIDDYSALEVIATFSGKYENIRSLIAQMNILGRLKYISEISIQRSAKSNVKMTEIESSDERENLENNIVRTGNDQPAEELILKITAYFGYAPRKMMINSASLEVFHTKEINFSPIDKFFSFIPLEDAYVGESGKNNLFLPEK